MICYAKHMRSICGGRIKKLMGKYKHEDQEYCKPKLGFIHIWQGLLQTVPSNSKLGLITFFFLHIKKMSVQSQEYGSYYPFVDVFDLLISFYYFDPLY